MLLFVVCFEICCFLFALYYVVLLWTFKSKYHCYRYILAPHIFPYIKKFLMYFSELFSFLISFISSIFHLVTMKQKIGPVCRVVGCWRTVKGCVTTKSSPQYDVKSQESRSQSCAMQEG